MSKRPDPNQMLLNLARNEGQDVVHLPYTPEFESVCQRINPAATTEDKHRIWEKLLDLREVSPAPGEAAVPAQWAPIIVPQPEPSAMRAKPPALISRAPEESGLLF